jgi:hypothetical protein
MSGGGTYAKPRLAGRGFAQSTWRLVASLHYRNALPQRTGGRKCLPPAFACRRGWRGIWRISALGRAALTERTFPDHRQAALALLNGNHRLSRKAGQFLGQLAVDSSPMSEAQAGWLYRLLDRAALPPLAEGGAA